MALCGLSNCFSSSEAQRENYSRAAQPSAVTPPANNSSRVSTSQPVPRALGTAAQHHAASTVSTLTTRLSSIDELIAQVNQESTASTLRTPAAGISQTADPVRSSLLARIEKRINAPNESNDNYPLSVYSPNLTVSQE